MNYWQGRMDWPLDANWKCEICGKNTGLEWGMVHGQARCNTCHMQYTMRNSEDTVVTIPICQVKPEYREASIEIWNRLNVPMDQVENSEWDKVLKDLATVKAQ